MPSISFRYDGGRPLIPAEVKVGREQATALVDAGRPVPRQMAGLFYLDSGADTTVIDRSFVTNLNLQYIGNDQARTAMSGARLQSCDIHKAGIEVNGPAGTGFAYDINDLDFAVFWRKRHKQPATVWLAWPRFSQAALLSWAETRLYSSFGSPRKLTASGRARCRLFIIGLRARRSTRLSHLPSSFWWAFLGCLP